MTTAELFWCPGCGSFEPWKHVHNPRAWWRVKLSAQSFLARAASRLEEPDHEPGQAPPGRALDVALAAVPSLVTLLGLAAALYWFAGGPGWLLLASLAADGLDGWLARKLGAVTKFGAELDLAADTVIAAGLAGVCFGPLGVGALALWIGAARALGLHGGRISGRVLLTFVALYLARLPGAGVWGIACALI